ncbi:MAG: PAS domain-containing protein, partial [Phycisphaerales bacterium]|nr:PAS domain-containing protein [Phycisphaerales bacterium]
LERLAMQAPAMIWTVDRDLRITESVGSALEQIGLVPGQTVGLTLQEHFKTDDPDFPSIAAHRRALQGEKVTYSREMNGRTYQSRIAPLRDDQSRIIGAVGISFDITGAKPGSA